MGLEDVGVRLIAENEAQFNAALKNAQAGIDHLDDSVKKTEATQKKSSAASDKMSQSFRKMGEAVVAAFAVEKVLEFGKQTITAASDMNETLSKSKVVFGDLSVEIEKMGDQAATSMGLSKQEAIAAAATYGNLFTAMGMGEDVSAKMSMNLVQLASDLASFNNIPVGDALEKLRAGLVGEAEPLKSLGINLNEATLKEKAMVLGLSDGKGVLDASAKAQAAYAIMLDQSTKAQGDFARTSDGLANQQRILEANWKNLQVRIGDGLLPAFLSLVKAGNQVLNTIDQLGEMTNGYRGILKSHAKDILYTSDNYEDYVIELYRANRATMGVKMSTEEARAEFYRFGGNLEYTASKVEGVTNAEYDAARATDTAAKAQAALNAEMELTDQNMGGDQAAYNAFLARMKGITDEVKAADEATKQLAQNALAKLKTAMSGAVGKELADYNKSYNDLNGELQTTEAKMQALLKVKVWTPEQQTEYGNLLTAQDNIKAKIDEVKLAHEKATAQWLLDDLLTRMSLDGPLTQAEIDFANEFAYQHGLIDEATLKSIQQNEAFLASLNGAAPTWEAWEKYIKDIGTAWNNVPTSKTTTYTVKTVKIGDEPGPPAKIPSTPGWGSGSGKSGGPQALGGDYMVTKPTWFLAGEAGPERALFIPQAGGPTTNNYNTSYNLSVMTSQSPQVIQRSFALMKLLAG